MKKVIALGLLIFTIAPVLAQEVDSVPQGNFQNVIDSLFMQIDKTDITTDVLEQKGGAHIPFKCYRGVYNSEYDRDSAMSSVRWSVLYDELYAAQTDTIWHLPTPDSVLSRVIAHRAMSYTPISVLFFEYNYFNVDSLEDYFDLTDGMLADDAQRTVSPYREALCFAGSVCSDEKLSGNITFILPSNLFFSNTTVIGSATFRVDFGDGQGWQTVSADAAVNISYATAGVKDITVEMTLNSVAYTSKMKLNVKYKANTFGSATALYYNPSNQTFGTGTNYHAAAAFMMLASGHTTPVKPIIFVEGFDALEEFDLEALFNIINNGVTNLSPTYPTYRSNNPFSFDNIGLIDRATDWGYDFIILDLAGTGGDRIENNAEILRSLIKWAINAGAADIVVGGASMGGLVARYCLAKMEKVYCEDHKTSMYISYDAPQKGANIPIGIQYVLKKIHSSSASGISPDIRQQYRALSSPAARQMLLEHILTGYPFGPDQMYYDLQTQFDILGYPEKCRRIALSNGNATGNGVNTVLAAQNGLNTSAYNPLDEILTITNNTSSGTRINIHCMAQTNTAALQIAAINVGIYLAGAKVKDIIKGNLLHQSYLDYDNSPGGFLTTQRFIVDGVQSIGFFSGSTATTNNRDQHCMIPMTSAIDLKCPQCTTLVQNHTPDYYLDNFLTPFDNIFFYEGVGNYGHADNVERQASWFILDELLDHLNVTGPPTSDTYLKSPLSTTFNFGTLAHNVIVGSLTINSGGKLQINGDYATYYGSGPTPAGGSAQYSVYSAPCSTNVISIQGGGTIEVGDQYSSSHKGNLVISDQSTLEIENDGELIVRAGSRVVIKPGGKLNFKEGAIINLVSTTSVLEIQGELVLGNNANFTITGSGYIKFSLPDGTTAQSIPITASNSNCTFVLSTNNQTNKVMEVTKGWVIPSSNLSLFKIYKGTVELGTDAYLNLGCKTEINNTTITSNVGSGYVHKGVKLGNQSVSEPYATAIFLMLKQPYGGAAAARAL